MPYTVYETTNLINGKIYIGTHKTQDISDDYLGSGKILKKAIKKYGIENFKKEILEVFDNAEDMFAKEAQLVTEAFTQRKDTYNIKKGGLGGWDYTNNSDLKKQYNKLGGEVRKRQMLECGNPLSGVKTKSNFCKNKKNQHKAVVAAKSEDSRLKRKSTFLKMNHQKGSNNSQYGTCWIYNTILNENKKIQKEDLQLWVDKGWLKGRKIK